MRPLGISTGPITHLDHLGVLCSLLEIPLIVTDERAFEIARRCYPDLEVHLVSWNDLSLEALADHADILFGCGKYWTESLLPSIACVCGKKMRFVFCPHGNSDKGRSLKPNETHPQQDIALIYGDHMHNLLKETGALSHIHHIVRSGNYREFYYQRNREFYDALANEWIFHKVQTDRKILLYAPTWPNKENPSPVFAISEKIVDQLSSDFTLLIKWHPLLEEFYPGPTYRFLGRYDGHPHVHFVNDFPCIYPLLKKSDAYIGDFSSIGYDFLFFDRPLYFLTTSSDSPLFSCGMPLSQDALAPFLQTTWEENQTRFSQARKKLYCHVFGDLKDITDLRSEIFALAKRAPAGTGA